MWMMTTLQDFKEDLGLLVEAGLLAIKQGDEESAKKIFDACDVLDDDGVQKAFGYGLIAMHKMEIPKAIESFQSLLKKDPENWRATAFLGFAYILTIFSDDSATEKSANLKKALELSQKVLDNCKEKSTLDVARSIQEWEKETQKIVKKTSVMG